MESGIVGDKIDDLLEKLQNVVDGSVEKANDCLTAAESVINKTAGKIENQAVAALDQLQDTFEKGLDELKNKAAKAGVNIDDCLGENEKRLVNLPAATVYDMIECVQGLVIQPIRYISDALDTVNMENLLFF